MRTGHTMEPPALPEGGCWGCWGCAPCVSVEGEVNKRQLKMEKRKPMREGG